MNISAVRKWIKVSDVRGDEVLGLCPYHNDSKPSFWVNLKKQVFYCFGCHAKGRLGNTKEANQFLRFDSYQMLYERLHEVQHKKAIDMPSDFTVINHMTNLNQDYWRYLVNVRKLKLEVIRKYGVGYCWDGDYQGRVIIPLQIGFVGRSVFPENLMRITTGRDEKYLYPIGFPKSDVLFNYRRRMKDVVLVEGVFDALNLIGMGYNAVSILGSIISKYQINMLCKSKTHSIVLAFDGDEAGKFATDRIYSMLIGLFSKVYTVNIGDGLDPGDLDSEEWDDVYRGRCEYRKRHYFIFQRFKEILG